MRTNHVFIDFESVQPDSLDALDHEHYRVHIFVGANQTKLPFEIAAAIQRMGSRASYVKIAGSGPNALDFHIAFYMGRLAAQDSSAFFHVVSKDKGFDPLIQHLKSQKIFADRITTVGDIPLVKVANAKSPEDRIAAVVAKLLQMKSGKPRTPKTLRSTIAGLFHKQLSETDVESLIKALADRRVAVVAANRVSYGLVEDS